ncbi:hypothetical protein BZA70DRAFT_312957 [Myxozyma melibiosi]|uniref:Uncharacterized protein n=1 Tax=Myxozyma melibiosi TaxID=54550 RepID=A0ABR1F178_9ASCO
MSRDSTKTDRFEDLELRTSLIAFDHSRGYRKQVLSDLARKAAGLRVFAVSVDQFFELWRRRRRGRGEMSEEEEKREVAGAWMDVYTGISFEAAYVRLQLEVVDGQLRVREKLSVGVQWFSLMLMDAVEEFESVVPLLFTSVRKYSREEEETVEKMDEDVRALYISTEAEIQERQRFGDITNHFSASRTTQDDTANRSTGSLVPNLMKRFPRPGVEQVIDRYSNTRALCLSSRDAKHFLLAVYFHSSAVSNIILGFAIRDYPSLTHRHTEFLAVLYALREMTPDDDHEISIETSAPACESLLRSLNQPPSFTEPETTATAENEEGEGETPLLKEIVLHILLRRSRGQRVSIAAYNSLDKEVVGVKQLMRSVSVQGGDQGCCLRGFKRSVVC